MKTSLSSKRTPIILQRDDSKRPKIELKRVNTANSLGGKNLKTQVSSNFLLNNTGKNAKMLLDKCLKEGLEHIKNLVGKKEGKQYEIFHYFEKKNLEIFETELLYNLLEETKKSNKELPLEIEEINLKNKAIQFDYETLDKAREQKDFFEKELIRLEIADNDAQYERNKLISQYDSMNKENCEYFKNESLIDFEIARMNEEHMALDQTISALCDEEYQLKEKKKENNQIRIDLLTYISLFKPFFKRFLILRSKDKAYNDSRVIICNKKKVLGYLNGYNAQIQFKFDYIFSLYNNYNELPSSLNDVNDYLNDEVGNIIFQMTTKHEDSKSVFVTYLMNLEDSLNYNIVLHFLNDLVLRLVSVLSDVSLTISLVSKNCFIGINNGQILTVDKNFDLRTLLKYDFRNTNIEEVIFGIMLNVKLKKNKTSSQLKVLLLDMNTLDLIKCIHVRLAEINNNKIKGKNVKSGQKIITKEFNHVIDEIDENFNYFPCFIDLDIQSNIIKGENNSFHSEILQKFYK